MVNKKTSKKREDITTIQISKEFKEELNRLGERGESYEDIIRRLIKK